MKKITNIILEFDGTLGDPATVIIQTMQATIKERTCRLVLMKNVPPLSV